MGPPSGFSKQTDGDPVIGKPVAHNYGLSMTGYFGLLTNYGLLSIKSGLLWGVVASYLVQLGSLAARRMLRPKKFWR